MQRKPMNNLKRSILALSAIAFISTTAAQAKRYMTSGFRTTETRPKTIAILPPHADFIKKKVLVSHELVEEAAVLERSASAWIGRMLEDKGYKVQIVTQDRIRSDAELGEIVHRINNRYAEEWKKIIRKPKKVKARRYNVGDEIRKATAYLEVDGIVVPRIQAVGTTTGQQVMAAIFGGNMGYARLDLAVVDGDSGTVEAYFFGLVSAGFKSLTNKPDKVMMKVAKFVLKKYPKPTQVLRAKGKVEVDDDDDDDESDEVVLGDLEALLGAEPAQDDESEDGSPQG